MTRTMVTGGTGFLGEFVVRELADRGDSVVVLARSASRVFDGLEGVEFARGDVTDGASVSAAMAGVSQVFHLAGMVSRGADDAQAMMRVHVDGTRVVMRAAAAASVGRVVLASSSGTIAVSESAQMHDETSGFATTIAGKWPYYASKIYQEKVATELASELGIELVVVSPSLLLGPGDRRLSSTKDVRKFLRGQLPTIPGGGVNFVDARDAALATIAAMDKGRAGERYLLGGPNWTCEEFFARLGRIAKMSGPRLKLPRKFSEWGAQALVSGFKMIGREAPIDPESVELAEHFWYFDSSKAKRELGFSPRDPQLTLGDTVKYLRQDLDG